MSMSAHTAHVGEPQYINYPSNKPSKLEEVVYALWFVVLICIVSALTSPQVWIIHREWLYSGLAVCLVLVVAAVFESFYYRSRRASKRWRETFLHNNADLKLDFAAIEATLRHMNRASDYRGYGFKRTAVAIAMVRRFPENQRNVFVDDAAACYAYAIGERKDVPQLYLPRWQG